MKLDLVHDLQAAYRQVLKAMAGPGLIASLREQAIKVDVETALYPATLILALMLLDTEVTFKVFAEKETEINRLISQLTYAKTAAADRADFIFVLRDAGPGALQEALELAYPGDLLNPHRAATLIVEADLSTSTQGLVLTGPGIPGERRIADRAAADWVERRADKNSEYPLGIEMIFTDSEDNIIGLPRTTQIQRGADKWDM
jgi:alpha-D-ribose 1-methylphosphonate 5-triphosphate synthase subunit PhnH